MSAVAARAQQPAPRPSRFEPGSFEVIASESKKRWLAQADAYSAAMAFARGEIDIEGDLVAAVRAQLGRALHDWRAQATEVLTRFAPWRISLMWQSRAKAARDIRFHYDRSNEFYKSFLDSRMVYSCAYFRSPDASLDEAQIAKLDHICRKLRLAPGERFLDIGCGWGALLRQAALRYGAHASGCTLSHAQEEYNRETIRRDQLEDVISVREMDYRDLRGQFDKITSVGMFEHVGKMRLAQYFRKVYELLAPEGMFLNHGITRPDPIHNDAQTSFIARKVFPGGEIVTLGSVVEAAEKAGFEVLDVENLRMHYARTCQAWVDRLRANREACLRAVEEETWRIWQLYLAGSAVAFSNGELGLHQVLLAKRGSPAVHMTRDYMYPGGGARSE